MKTFAQALGVVLLVTACSNNDWKAPKSLTPAGEPPREALSATAPNIYEFDSVPEGQKLSIHIYAENDQWIVEKSVIADDGFPDPQPDARRVFSSGEKAYDFARAAYGIDPSRRRDDALDIPPPKSLPLSENLAKKEVLWKATQNWSWDWEIAFAKWMRANIHPEFFSELGIENDCADAYYQARMIFARLNNLPVSFRLAGNGAWFTQDTMRAEWLKLKTNADWKIDQRFMKVLDYIANTTYTHTLGRDTYPIALTKEGLIEGAAYLSLDQTSGHTLLVNEINVNSTDENDQIRLPMYTLNSTVPKEVRPLYESFFVDAMQPQKSPYGYVGFVRFRWPKSIGAAALVDANKMPHYSEEQYDPNLMLGDPDDDSDDETNFSLFVFKRLNPQFDPTLRITEGIVAAKLMLSDRIEVVKKGYEVCKKGCADGGADYEAWSTPTRDGRLKTLLHDLETYAQNMYSIETVGQAWQKGLGEVAVTVDGVEYLLSHVKWTWDNGLYGTDPNQTPDDRWAMAPSVIAQRAHDEITPLLLARNKKIASAKCASCELFSFDFLKAGTFMEDASILSKKQRFAAYCNVAGQQRCDDFKKQMTQKSGSVPAYSSFAEAWDKADLLNADPGVSPEQRWGAFPAIDNTLTFDGVWSLKTVSKNNLILLTNEVYGGEANEEGDMPMIVSEDGDGTSTSYKVVNAQTQQVIYEGKSSGYVGMDMYLGNGQILIADYGKNRVQWIDPVTQSVQVIEPPLFDIVGSPSSSWIDANRILISLIGGVHLYEKQDAGFELSRSFPGYTWASNEFITKVVGSTISVIDVTDVNYPEFSVDVSKLVGFTPNDGSVYASMNTKKALVVSASYYDETVSKNGSVLIVPSLKTAKKFPYDYGVNDGMLVQSTDANNTILFFNDVYDIVGKHVLPAGEHGCYGSNCNIFSIGKNVYSADRPTASVKTIASLSHGKVESSWGSLGIVRVNPVGDDYGLGQSFLIDFKTAKVLKKGPGLSFLTQLSPTFYPALQSSWYYDKTVGNTYSYYSFNSVLSLDHLSEGSLTTGAQASAGGEVEGVTYEAAPLTDDDIKKSLQGASSIQTPTVNLVGGGYQGSLTNPPYSLITGGQKTLLVFRYLNAPIL